MKNYTALNKQVYKNGAFSLVPLRFEDRYDIMKWRNEQLYHLRQAKPLTEEDQDIYFNKVVAKLFDREQPDQILFSFLKDAKCIGYGGLVHINWIDKNAEISFIMASELEVIQFEENWTSYLTLIEDVAFAELRMHKIYTFAFDLRPRLYQVLEDCDFKLEAELVDHCFFNGSYKNVVIHSKFNAPLSC